MATARSLRREVVAPYQTLDGYISKVRYRYSPSAKFQEIETSSRSLYVPVDDLRTIPRHELAVSLSQAQLHKIYAKHLDKLALVVLTRDNVLKKEQVLYRSPIASLPESFVLDPEKLKETSLRADLALEVSICALALDGGGTGWPTRRASRLAVWYINLSNHSKGPRFPWIRKTAEEFRAKDLPANTTFYVHLLGAAEDLVADGDTIVEEVLEVWVHEDAWVALQQSETSPGVAAIQRQFVAGVALQILELMLVPLTKGTAIAEKSLCDALLGYISAQNKVDAADIEAILKKKKSTVDVAPYVTAAFGVNRAMKRVTDD